MNMKSYFNIGFRAYAIAVVLGALVTVASIFNVVNLSTNILGSIWVLLAVLGAIVIVGMTTQQQVVLVSDQTNGEKERFETTDLTGLPLSVYFVSAAIWAGVSFGWILGGRSLDTLFAIGYGWLAIAAYGAILGLGIAINHSRDITKSLAPNKEIRT